jgi:hypothetical protein
MKNESNGKQAALKVLKRRLVMKAGELSAYIPNRTQLRRLAQTGELVEIGAGFYAHPSVDPFVGAVLATAKAFPDAVISNVTALVILGLSDERIDRIDVDVPRGRSIRNKLVRAHRVPKSHLVGAVSHRFHGQRIRIHSRERALCEAYRIDPGGAIFFKALKRYVRAGELNPDQVAAFDEVLGTAALTSLSQELADG